MFYAGTKTAPNLRFLWESLPAIIRPVDYRLVSHSLTRIHQAGNIFDIVHSLLSCLESVLHQDVPGFALFRDHKLRAWWRADSPPELWKTRLQTDFPCSNFDEVHLMGVKRPTPQSSLKDLIAYPLEGQEKWRALIYVSPRGLMSQRQSEALKILLAGARDSLDKCLAIARLEKDVTLDHLTNCLNRRALETWLDHDIAKAHRYGNEFSLVLFDIDHFKKINDRFGHQMGDGVLRQIASFTASKIRKSDYLARYGGEEFVICLPNTRLYHAQGLAETLRQALEENPFAIREDRLQVTASFGVAALRPGTGREDLLAEADRMLYLAKASGRNLVHAVDIENRPAAKVAEGYKLYPV